MTLYIEDLIREVDILNWYKGEALKRGDVDAAMVQSANEQQDALLYHLRQAVIDVLNFANANRVKFTCEYRDDCLRFSLSPLREGREYLLSLLKENIRQYLVYEVRRLWMTEVAPKWADSSLRESLRENIRQVMNDATSMGVKVRRRYAWIG